MQGDRVVGLLEWLPGYLLDLPAAEQEVGKQVGELCGAGLDEQGRSQGCLGLLPVLVCLPAAAGPPDLVKDHVSCNPDSWSARRARGQGRGL